MSKTYLTHELRRRTTRGSKQVLNPQWTSTCSRIIQPNFGFFWGSRNKVDAGTVHTNCPDAPLELHRRWSDRLNTASGENINKSALRTTIGICKQTIKPHTKHNVSNLDAIDPVHCRGRRTGAYWPSRRASIPRCRTLSRQRGASSSATDPGVHL